MTNKEAAAKINFGVDLCKQARNHVEFLKAVDSVCELKDHAVLRRAVYRYERFWLPLASEHPEKCLSAPLDVEWVWHCHLLSPVAYERDCLAVVAATVNHEYRNQEELKTSQKEAECYWDEKYKEKGEPFYLDYSMERENSEMERFNSKLSYDIVAAADRQKDFVKKLSSPLYGNDKFLENSLQRYKQFIYLETQIPELQIVPANDIDLMWHSHQANPMAYKEDMVRITGVMLDHDDTDTDQSEGSALYNAAHETMDTWGEFYGDSLLLNISMLETNGGRVSTEMGTCYNRCSIHKSEKDAEMNEMGTCYNRCSIRKSEKDAEMKELGTCYQRCTIRKSEKDAEMKEMGTCYNRCTIHKSEKDAEMNEMGTCYNRCTIRKSEKDAEMKEMGTCYNRCTIRKSEKDAEMKEMGTCYNRCTIHKSEKDAEMKEMGTCYNRCTIHKSEKDAEMKEMGTCYNRCTIHKLEKDAEMKEMGTCYNRCTIRKSEKGAEMKEMGTCYNRCTIRKSEKGAEMKEMGTCYNKCTIRKLEKDAEMKEMGTCYNRCSIRKLLPPTRIKEMGTCYNRCSISKLLPQTEMKAMDSGLNKYFVGKKNPTDNDQLVN